MQLATLLGRLVFEKSLPVGKVGVQRFVKQHSGQTVNEVGGFYCAELRIKRCLFESENPTRQRQRFVFRNLALRRHGNLTPDTNAAFTDLLGQHHVGAFVLGVFGFDALERGTQRVSVNPVAGETILGFVELVVGKRSAGRQAYGQH